MLAENLLPGDIVTSAGDVIVSGPTDHGTYVAYVVRSTVNGAVHLRYWDKGYDVTLRRAYNVTGGPHLVTEPVAVRYCGGRDAFDVAFANGYVEDVLTRDEGGYQYPVPR